jgi:hypothetical protein
MPLDLEQSGAAQSFALVDRSSCYRYQCLGPAHGTFYQATQNEIGSRNGTVSPRKDSGSLLKQQPPFSVAMIVGLTKAVRRFLKRLCLLRLWTVGWVSSKSFIQHTTRVTCEVCSRSIACIWLKWVLAVETLTGNSRKRVDVRSKVCAMHTRRATECIFIPS